MATIVNFGNKQLIEPGSSSRTLGGSTPSPSPSTFGNVLLIDTGVGYAFGGGGGVNGTITKDKAAIYEMIDPLSAKWFFKGGILYDLVDYLFAPSTKGAGIPKLIYIKAATTTPALIGLEFANGIITIRAKNEGSVGNGVITNGLIRRGYGVRLKAGVIDPNKFIFELSEGTFRGLDENSEPWNGIVETRCSPILYESPEIATLPQLKAWMDSNQTFQSNFDYIDYEIGNGGTIVSGDITGIPLTPFNSGSESYGSGDIDKAISYADDIDHTFFLGGEFEADAAGVNNNKILTNILGASNTKFLFIGGSRNAANFVSQSIETAQYFDSPNVVVVHSGPQVINAKKGFGLKDKTSLHSAALALGRIAGLAPQVPGTWKDVRMVSPVHDLTKLERIQALQAGVLHFKKVDPLGWVINQSVNTLQNNTTQILPDGTSFEISIMRIAAQLNKELQANVNRIFIGNNANLSSPAEIASFVKNYLQGVVATKSDDNLILSYKNVVVTLVDDTIDTRYEFMPNGPVNKFVATGFMLNVKL